MDLFGLCGFPSSCMSLKNVAKVYTLHGISIFNLGNLSLKKLDRELERMGELSLGYIYPDYWISPLSLWQFPTEPGRIVSSSGDAAGWVLGGTSVGAQYISLVALSNPVNKIIVSQLLPQVGKVYVYFFSSKTCLSPYLVSLKFKAKYLIFPNRIDFIRKLHKISIYSVINNLNISSFDSKRFTTFF